MHRRGSHFGEQCGAAGVRLETQLVFRQGVVIQARGIGAIAELLVIGGGTGAGQQEDQQHRGEPSHFLFFFRSGFAAAATGSTSERESSAR